MGHGSGGDGARGTFFRAQGRRRKQQYYYSPAGPPADAKDILIAIAVMAFLGIVALSILTAWWYS